MAIDSETGQNQKPTTTAITNRMPIASRAAHQGRQALRGLARGLGLLFVLILSLALMGATYEALAASGDARAYPPPGRLVDVGGYRLHIHCSGTGSPTVVLDAGLGGMSHDWNLVQAEIAQTTRVCAYDRAGMGWSDAGPQPRTPDRIARELHTLLTNANVEGPYVLVGHSLGGKNVRMFALHHPEQVAGMVLVDTRSEVVDLHTSRAEEDAFQRAMRDQSILDGRMRRFGLVRLFGANVAGMPTMTKAIRMEMALFATGQRGRDTTLAESLERATHDAHLQAAPSLGDRPLIVLASGQNMEMLPSWPEAQRQQAGLSTNGRLIIAEGGGHYIHWEQPNLVIDAVRQVVGQVRGDQAQGDFTWERRVWTGFIKDAQASQDSR